MARSTIVFVIVIAIALLAGGTPNHVKRSYPSNLPKRLKLAMDRDLSEVTVSKLQAYYAQKKYTVRQVISWYLDRINTMNPRFKAFVYVYGDEALARAAKLDASGRRGLIRGPLWGVPVIIKGSTSIAGKITTNGWEAYARPGTELIATRNATVVDKLERAGAIVLGHANMPDLGKSDSNVSSLGGRTGNAYNIHFSPGGSSGGVATALALNLGVIGQGTDTGNSIRNPASTSSLVGVLPTHGLVSVAGIHPYDKLLDNTGPMARTVTDAAIALDVMSGEDPNDPRTARSVPHRPRNSFRRFLRPDALKGRRFGVPKFILDGAPSVHPNAIYHHRGTSPETKALFMEAVEKLKAAGATVIFADDILPEEFARIADSYQTKAYREAAMNQFLSRYAPPKLSSLARLKEAGIIFPAERFTDGIPQCEVETDPKAQSNYFVPHQKLIDMYIGTMQKHRLDGFVYPALQIPPNDERTSLPKDFPSDGPYSFSNWVNRLGAPAIVVPAGFYPNGLPFGLEISSSFWKDGELLGYAFAFEQLTRVRRPPELRDEQ